MADQIIGATLELSAEQANQTVKEFKQQLKTANAELLLMVDKFGATSKEAQAAAKKVAELKDTIADNKTLVDAFNPDRKFNAFAQSVGAVTGGFAALQGIMGLVGSESEDLTRSLLKVQSALAISQGLDTIKDSIASVKTLGAQLVANLGKNGLIGIAVVGVTALALSIYKLIDGAKSLSAAEKGLADTTKDYASAAAGAIQKVNEVESAFESARQGVISKEEALKTYNETLGDSFGRTNDLAKAEQNVADKADTYIKVTALKAQANALFAKSAEASANALVIQQQFEKDLQEGLPEGLADKVSKQLQRMRDDALEVQNIGESLLRQAQSLAKAADINLGGPKKEPGKTNNKPDEVEALKTQFKREHIQTRAELDKEEADREEAQRIADRAKVESHYLALNGFFKGYVDNAVTLDLERTRIEEANAAQRRIIAEEEKDAKLAALKSVSSALGAVAELIGKQTAAGKVLGIAQATINTWIGVTEILRNKTVLPEPFGTISKIASITGVIAAGLNAVKNIVKVQVPGGGSAGGGGGSLQASASAPLSFQPQIGRTQLDQDSLNQIGNAATRAYVLESDVTNNRERIVRLSRQARLG